MNDLNSILKSSATLPLHKSTLLNLLCTSNFFTAQYHEFFKAFDITGQQYNVLRILRGQKGVAANLSTIQERMIHKNSNTSRIIDKLLSKKYVDRKQCLENRRKIEVSITFEGRELLKKIDPLLDHLEIRLTQELKHRELESLNSLLEKLRT